MNPSPQVFDSAFLASLAARAAASPRRRLNHNLHADNSYPCHRIFNAVQPDSYIPVHR
ncbi:MAG: WbuC family cupin fold metalloprotein, partial [Kiritimatiellae bacterium]|nr:WbuC family cupin fold metalloprotein [Kiritimatiellia bacterium]